MSPLLLIAQAEGPGLPNNDIPLGAMILMIVGAGVGVLITAIVTGIKYATKERELQHTERLKAIEKGFLVDDIEEERRFRKGIMRLAGAIGVAVPICAVGAATGAVTGMGSAASSMIVFLIWTGAAAVGVTGAASGAWLAQAAIARLSPGRRDRQVASVDPRLYETSNVAAAR